MNTTKIEAGQKRGQQIAYPAKRQEKRYRSPVLLAPFAPKKAKAVRCTKGGSYCTAQNIHKSIHLAGYSAGNHDLQKLQAEGQRYTQKNDHAAIDKRLEWAAHASDSEKTKRHEQQEIDAHIPKGRILHYQDMYIRVLEKVLDLEVEGIEGSVDDEQSIEDKELELGFGWLKRKDAVQHFVQKPLVIGGTSLSKKQVQGHTLSVFLPI